MALSGDQSLGIDTLLPKERTSPTINVSPRLGVAFPITEYAKLFFNYGHFYQVPDPRNLFLLRRYSDNNQVINIADPTQPFPKTVQYELGYEHSLLDEYLIRVAAYYKDVTNESQAVGYTSKDSKVDYDRYTSNLYRDIRGFEISLYKNRGEWVQGFLNYTYDVRTFGRFGYTQYYESASDQRIYERTTNDQYQTKPLPAPYARANIDFFTPRQFGPEWLGQYILGDWRLNIVGEWQSGRYDTWVGGGSIPGVQYNVQWTDFWNFDMRLSKTFTFGRAALQFFVDVSNLFNTRYFNGLRGFFGARDYDNYMKSLHLPDFADDQKTKIGYINVPGEDRPGDYRKPGVDFQPIVALGTLAELQQAANQHPRPFYWVQEDRNYYQFVNGQWAQVAPDKLDQVLDDKAYIDMPNQDTFTFLNPRRVFYGLRFSFDM
jgi:hypothetical protein